MGLSLPLRLYRNAGHGTVHCQSAWHPFALEILFSTRKPWNGETLRPRSTPSRLVLTWRKHSNPIKKAALKLQVHKSHCNGVRSSRHLHRRSLCLQYILANANSRHQIRPEIRAVNDSRPPKAIQNSNVPPKKVQASAIFVRPRRRHPFGYQAAYGNAL